MYAVIKSGGKQYRVKEGDKLKLETLPAEVGAVVNLDEVLMIGEGQAIKVGRPSLDGAKVLAKVISHGRRDKIHVIKFRRRKHHEKWQGHRQNYTEVQITEIQG